MAFNEALGCVIGRIREVVDGQVVMKPGGIGAGKVRERVDSGGGLGGLTGSNFVLLNVWGWAWKELGPG